MEKRVLIAGAGISGLALGWYLQTSGIDFLICEAQAEVGGAIRTKNIDDYLVECGPTTLQRKDEELWKLVCALGIEPQVVLARTEAKKRYIVKGGRLVALPSKPQELIGSQFLSLKGKIRLLGDLVLPRSDSAHSPFEYVRSRLGLEAAEYLLDPFVSGVYAGNARELSFEAAFPKLYAASRSEKSLIRATRTLMSAGAERHTLYSFQNGLQVLPNELEKRLNAKIKRKIELISVAKSENGYQATFIENGTSHQETFTHVVLTVPAYVASKIVSSLESHTAQHLGALDYPPLVSVFTAFKREHVSHALDGFGFLCPSKENRFLLGSVWASSLFDRRAKQSEVGLTAMVGGAHHRERAELPEEKIIEKVLKDYQLLLGLQGFPTECFITRWRRSIPQYTSQQLDCVKSIEILERTFPGIHISGNLRGGVSIGACVKESARVFSALVELQATFR